LLEEEIRQIEQQRDAAEAELGAARRTKST
jgi:hypothetical protein